jgi:hypothetical protein
MEGYAFTRGWTIFSNTPASTPPFALEILSWLIQTQMQVCEKLPRPFEPPRLKVTHAVWELKCLLTSISTLESFFGVAWWSSAHKVCVTKKKTLWSKLSFSVSFDPHFSVEIRIWWHLSICCCWWTNKHTKVHQFSITPLSNLLSPNCT